MCAGLKGKHRMEFASFHVMANYALCQVRSHYTKEGGRRETAKAKGLFVPLFGIKPDPIVRHKMTIKMKR